MKTGLKAFFVHFFVTVFFTLVALTYFHPVLQGKVIFQSDIAQYTGMAKEQNDFRKKTGQEPYWTNSAFGGMPTYQLGAYYPHDYVKQVDRLIRFLPRPADYLFIYLMGFYILLSCLKVDFRLAVLGALAFGFSTYLIIILGVGHNAKAHAIGYLPMLLGGIVLVFRKKYLWGFVLTAIAMALEVGANHYQMTYYFMLLVILLGLAQLVDAIRIRELKHFGISVGILVLAVALGISANASSLMATKEYADWSTRGKSELTIDALGNTKDKLGGLDKEYITQYSYGIAESMNLFVPRLFGGSNAEDLGENSITFAYVVDKEVPKNTALQYFGSLPLYWGDQPGVAAPAYIGAIVFFLFLMGLILVKGKTKWWLLGGVVMSLMLSWGKNFGLLTDFMIDYFPLYDKFRAVSSIQVILELCAPVLGILALKELYGTTVDDKEKLKALKMAFLGILVWTIALFLFKGMFDFSAPSDERFKLTGMEQLPEMIRLDRKVVYNNDLLRSMIYVILAALTLWFYLKSKIGRNLLVVILGILIMADLVGVDKRYVNKEDFVAKRTMSEPFPESAADKQIAKDEGIFRVYDPEEGLNGARTSYYHQSIGGYHAAKPAALQDLFEFHIYKANMGVLNMLNVKYVVQTDEEGKVYPALNPDANGNAWFVKNVISVNSADQEISALDSIDTKKVAVVNTSLFAEIDQLNFQVDSTASIDLTKYEPNDLTYRSINTNAGIAVFSEMYYPKGWNAYIDGKITPYFRANYALRALKVPAGEHLIEFKFQPTVVAQGGKIALTSSAILAVVVLGGLFFSFWRSRKDDKIKS